MNLFGNKYIILATRVQWRTTFKSQYTFKIVNIPFKYTSFFTMLGDTFIVTNLESSKCVRFFEFSLTVKRLKTDILPDQQMCPSYKDFLLTWVIFD